jgi:3-oxoacyl-[acyl-carrier-protein] synthase-3
VDNRRLEARLGKPVDAWLRANVGIEARHYMRGDAIDYGFGPNDDDGDGTGDGAGSFGEDSGHGARQTTSDLAAHAGAQALARAGLDPAALDLIVVATDTPDQLSPATASVVQAKLAAPNAAAFDVNCACASFVTAVDVAAKAIATDTDYDAALVVGAYGMSRFIDWSDKTTATLFADGAGAVVLRAGTAPGVLATKLRAFGRYHDALGIFAGGARRPATPQEVAAHGKPRVEFAKKLPASFNLDHWPPLVRDALAKAGLTPDDVRLFVFTQLNLRTIEAVMQRLGQPMSRTHWVMDKWGYTGSACVPMALDDAVAAGVLSPGDHVVLCASGGGIAMGASVIRWTAEPAGSGRRAP